MAPKIAIVYYSTWGHIKTLADAEKAGIEKAGGTVDMFQIPETLPDEILQKLYAPPKPTDIPVMQRPEELAEYDAFLLGVPTRFGNLPTQWKTFIDATGQLWVNGQLDGKFAGVFVSTAAQGGGQETTPLSLISTFVAHGINYVPLGGKSLSHILTNTTEVRGGSAWGAGTYAGMDGSRQPTEMELSLATAQGEKFYTKVAKYVS